MAIKLDKKDRKLLYELDLNSRQSFGILAKKLKLSKPTIGYRINRLIEKGVIKLFHTVVDAGKLGYTSFRLYISLHNATPEKEKEIIDFLKNKKMVTWVVSIEGNYDIGAFILTKEISEMNSLWKELLEKYVNYLDKRLLTVTTKVAYFSRAYLLGLKQNKFEVIFVTEPKEVKTDKTDKEILKLLSSNARIPIINIAQKLKLTSKTVIKRIKELEKKKIIIGYRTMFDLEKLGYEYFKVYFRLNNITKDGKKQFKDYIKIHPNIIYDVEVLGGDDIEIEIQAQNLKEFRQILKEIKSKFAKIIKEYKTMQFYKEHKYLFLPSEV